MNTYRTIEDDMLDRICVTAYNTEHPAVEAVLDRHYALSGGKRLSDLGPVYGVGEIVTLPDLSEDELNPVQQRRSNIFDTAYMSTQQTGSWPV